MSSPPSSGVMNPKPCDSCVRWKVNFFGGELMPSTRKRTNVTWKGDQRRIVFQPAFFKGYVKRGENITNMKCCMKLKNLYGLCLVDSKRRCIFVSGWTEIDACRNTALWIYRVWLRHSSSLESNSARRRVKVEPLSWPSIKNYLVGGFNPWVKLGIFSNFAGWKHFHETATTQL